MDQEKKDKRINPFSTSPSGSVADFFARLVARHDFIQGVILDNLSFQAKRLGEKLGDIADLTWKNRLRIVKYFSGGLLVFIVMLCMFNYVTGYEYSYNGMTLGLVKDQKNVTEVVSVAAEGLTKEYGVDVQIDPEEDFSYRKVVVTGKQTDTSDDILRKLTYVQNAKATAYSIYVDGNKAVTVSSEDEADKILGKIKGKYEDQDKTYDDVYFQEDVQIREVSTTVGKVMNSKVAYKALSKGSKVLNYEVKLGDTSESIAKNYNMTKAEFDELNPDTEAVLNEGDIVKVANTSANVTVVTEETVSYTEDIDYKVKKVKDDDIYEGEKEVKTKGEKGKKAITARVICENGKQTEKTILESDTEKEPVTEVVHIGTKERPKDVGTGKFINPCPAGTRTSGFGYRWGRLHKGLDLACATGNNIYAADNGRVITATSHYSYGNYIEIDHNNGYTTLYAHASKLLVKEGDVVEQGQVIAKVGSTGNSTGPHCHFQVGKNGTWVNPANYI